MTALLSGLATIAACAGAPSRDTIEDDGISVRANVVAVDTVPSGYRGRMMFLNRTDRPREIVIRGCGPWLRVYRPGDPASVWDQAQPGGGFWITYHCGLAHVPIAPRQSRELSTPIATADDILRDVLPDATYRLGVYVGTVRGELEFDLGEVHLESSLSTPPAPAAPP